MITGWGASAGPLGEGAISSDGLTYSPLRVRSCRQTNVEYALVKSFSCGEIVPDCPAVFSGSGYEDLLRQVADHAREVHGLLSVPPEVTAAVRAAAEDDALA